MLSTAAAFAERDLGEVEAFEAFAVLVSVHAGPWLRHRPNRSSLTVPPPLGPAVAPAPIVAVSDAELSRHYVCAENAP
jgi:hypothetical protein